MSRLVKMAAIAVFAGILGFSSRTSQATPLPSGTTVAGWTITYNVPGISLAIDQSPTGTILLEKTAGFTVNTGLLITFTQSGFTGVAPVIDIINESVTNASGANWTGFEYQLLTPVGTPTTFAGPAGIFVPPTSGPGVNYTGVSFSTTDIVYSGSQANGSTAFWGTTGGNNGGALIMNANASASGAPTTFTLKEIPLVATVPLPAAAWQGLSGLLGLGLIGYARKFKKLVA